MFVNLSNHPSGSWGEAQRTAAQQWGEIKDYPFPNVPPETDEAGADQMAADIVREVLSWNPQAVMCQGEMTVGFRIVQMLLNAGIPVMAACSRRVAEERTLEDGTTMKESVFRFCGFRAYGTPRNPQQTEA